MTTGYQLIEKESRVHAVDANGVEICGARQPYGHRDWIVYVHVRLTSSPHQVIATNRDAAVAHVEMIASLFVAASQGAAA